jgi:hypothetical protein
MAGSALPNKAVQRCTHHKQVSRALLELVRARTCSGIKEE